MVKTQHFNNSERVSQKDNILVKRKMTEAFNMLFFQLRGKVAKRFDIHWIFKGLTKGLSDNYTPHTVMHLQFYNIHLKSTNRHFRVLIAVVVATGTLLHSTDTNNYTIVN